MINSTLRDTLGKMSLANKYPANFPHIAALVLFSFQCVKRKKERGRKITKKMLPKLHTKEVSSISCPFYPDQGNLLKCAMS